MGCKLPERFKRISSKSRMILWHEGQSFKGGGGGGKASDAAPKALLGAENFKDFPNSEIKLPPNSFDLAPINAKV